MTKSLLTRVLDWTGLGRFEVKKRESSPSNISLNDLIFQARNSTGIPVNERSALTLTAAYACINVIATDLASLPIRLYRQRPGGGRDEVGDHPAAQLLKWSPDGEATSMGWRQAWMGHVLGWGNGYAEVTRDGSGFPREMTLCDPSTTEPKRWDKDGGLYYRLEDGRAVRPENMLHLAGFGFNGLSGYSPVKMARQAIGLAKAAETFGSTFFGNGSWAGGWLKVDRRLTDEALKNLVSSIEAVHRGSTNANRVGILPAGTEFTKSSVDPEDAQFLATRQFQVVEVCRIYRVPPHKVGDYSQAHLANVESSNLDYLVTTLRPWAVAMESVLTWKLLTEDERNQGYFFEHYLTALLRGDMKSRAEYLTKMRDLGAMNVDEIREAEGLNPIGGAEGALFLVPVNLVSLEKAASAPTEPAPIPVPAPDEDEEEPAPEDEEEPAEDETDEDEEEPEPKAKTNGRPRAAVSANGRSAHS